VVKDKKNSEIVLAIFKPKAFCVVNHGPRDWRLDGPRVLINQYL